ncbi:hypothetical protein [Caballeronia sp. LZ001]|nr:hypothetical protein [Caballeronia sp. LZ001]MDR5803795.1 hypothetical protein [Caballeronia sp. LZ001]
MVSFSRDEFAVRLDCTRVGLLFATTAWKPSLDEGGGRAEPV